jgi:carnosine N-methyltransferase
MSCCGGHQHNHHHNEEPTEEEVEEMNHFNEIIESFLNYKIDALATVKEDKRTRTAIEINAVLLTAIAQNGAGLFGQEPRRDETDTEPTAPRNISKVRSTLKQFVREWSSEGKEERSSSFLPLIASLERHLPKPSFVICPGSGLGRLPYELAKSGYDAQGNEFSYHMLLGSHFLLNGPLIQKPDQIPLFPFALNFSNCVSDKSRLRCVRVPDEVPCRTQGQMSMCAGEFVEVYERQGLEIADGVVTCFFIDTAKNILLYIRTIAGMLRTGGVWANLGPLLFHYAEQDDAISIELSWEEVRGLIGKYFDIVEEEYPVQCRYSGDVESLQFTEYNCVRFVARRNQVSLDGFSNPVFD